MRRHILISGTGRSGTTFLVQLFTALGFDTGFDLNQDNTYSNCNAGMEWDLKDSNSPFIVKSPWMCEYLDSVLSKGDIYVEHLIVPVRDLFSAAESRRDVMRRAEISGLDERQNVPGGLWGTSEPGMQEQALTERFYKLLWTTARYDVPLTLLDFPRIVRDPEYLRQKLIPIFGRWRLREKRFNSAFSLIIRPELVHDFKP
jgi:hypothetical protein